MALSKRSKATLFSVVAFGSALTLYLATRSDPPANAGGPAAHIDSDAVNQGRSLGRKLAGLLGSHGAPTATAEAPTHAAGPTCDKCTVDNCPVGTDDGCDVIADAADRKLCEDLYACFADPKSACVIAGDPVRCWCGTNMTTCMTDNSGPTQANGPCLQQIFAAAKTTDADTVYQRLMDIQFPVGRAVRVSSCRGSFCSNDCKIR
jgi:hypothetical protein